MLGQETGEEFPLPKVRCLDDVSTGGKLAAYNPSHLTLKLTAKTGYGALQIFTKSHLLFMLPRFSDF